jgi:uncharacterized membrane protein YozB (DUF420 family)
LWSHPIIQIAAALLGVYAVMQGVRRFMFHFGKKRLFQWKRHVKFGTVALILWVLGSTGFYVTHTVFEVTHITGIHADIAWIIVGLSVFGLITGYVLNKTKNRYKKLAVIHGVFNMVLFVLILVNFYSGIHLMRSFLFD